MANQLFSFLSINDYSKINCLVMMTRRPTFTLGLKVRDRVKKGKKIYIALYLWLIPLTVFINWKFLALNIIIIINDKAVCT